jgi:hypothetical protein
MRYVLTNVFDETGLEEHTLETAAQYVAAEPTTTLTNTAATNTERTMSVGVSLFVFTVIL